MTSQSSSPSADLWAEQWAIHAAVKADVLEAQMRVAAAGRALEPRQQAAMEAIKDLLRSARGATQRSGRRFGIRRPRGTRDRWRGTSVERAFQSLHAAEVFMVELLSEAEVRALTPKVMARADPVLERDDPRRELLLLSQQATGPQRRTAVQQTMEIAYDASDQMHVRVRDFRNILMLSAVLIALLMGLLTWVVSLSPDAMPLCFDPQSTAASSPAGSDLVCPSGENQPPSSADVLIVTGLGLLGGALAAAFAIRNVRGTSTPYGVPMALAFLKVPSGALTALAGLLLLGGDFVPGLSQLDSQRQILAYALVLGYAQQVATRLIDNRAQSILNSIPSKDTESRQHRATRPTPATPQPDPDEAPPARGLRRARRRGPS
jgi:hypothetical protein